MPEVRKTFSLVYYDLAAAPFLYSDALYRFAASSCRTRCFSAPIIPCLPSTAIGRPWRTRRRGEGEVPVGQREASFWRLIGIGDTVRGFMPNHTGSHGLVERFAPLIPAGKPVVDIAMGQGRDLLFLARKGFPSTVSTGPERRSCSPGRQRRRKRGAHAGGPGRRPRPALQAGHGGMRARLLLSRKGDHGDLSRLLMPGGLLLYETFLKRQKGASRAEESRLSAR